MTVDAALHPDVAHAAAYWYVQLGSGTASDADYQAWRAWRSADPEHERAWLRTEALSRQFDGIAPHAGLAALDRAPRSRRRAVTQLALLLTVGATASVAYRRSDWGLPAHRYRTATGAQRHVTLADGSRLLLNTATDVEVAFDASQRLLRLHDGEIMLETAHEQTTAYRPLRVATSAGTLTALGTRFIVRQETHDVLCSVQQGAVRVAPKAPGATPTVLQAGQQVRFRRDGIDRTEAFDSAGEAWTSGMLFADRMPLGAFVAEVGRYRRGYLGCDQAVAHLAISGAFPVADTDAIVQSLVDTLPLRATMLTRYWVRLAARSAPENILHKD